MQAHADLLAAHDLVLAAGTVQWTGPAADRFHERLEEAATAVAALAADVVAVGPARPGAFPSARALR